MAYARQPYTTWVLCGVLGWPFAVLALPLLLATGASLKHPQECL